MVNMNGNIIIRDKNCALLCTGRFNHKYFIPSKWQLDVKNSNVCIFKVPQESDRVLYHRYLDVFYRMTYGTVRKNK